MISTRDTEGITEVILEEDENEEEIIEEEKEEMKEIQMKKKCRHVKRRYGTGLKAL